MIVAEEIRAIVFDFNDTLSPSNFLSVFKAYEDRLGMQASEFIRLYDEAGLLDLLMRGHFAKESEFWLEVCRLTSVDYDLTQEMVAKVANTRQLDSEMVDLVGRLRIDYQVALATDNLLETFDFWIERFALDKMFDVITNSAECGYLKTQPEFYDLLAKRLNLPKSAILMIDDSLEKLEVALSGGFQVCLFREAHQLKRLLSEAGILVGN